ncbi:MAG TPA: ribosome-associated translation inhibitor RaiA [Kineosporiaceae bacterium]
MDIVITGRHTEVPERFRRLVEEKLAKVGQLAPKAHRADVEWSHERNPRQSSTCEKVEITIRGKGPVIRAEASAEDPAAALDIALGKLGERLRRTRDRRKVHHGRQAPVSLRQLPHGVGDDLVGLDDAGFTDLQHGDDAAGASPVVIRTKEHAAVPMTLDQALYEMELVGHDWFLFVDAETNRPSVVYRRKGWNYGVIRLEVTVPAKESVPAPVG